MHTSILLVSVVVAEAADPFLPLLFTGDLTFAGAFFTGAFLDLQQRYFEATGWRQT